MKECIDCNNPITPQANRCVSCGIKHKTKLIKICPKCNNKKYRYAELCNKCRGFTRRTYKQRFCLDCNKPISRKTKSRCQKCAGAARIYTVEQRKKMSLQTSCLLKERWKNDEFKSRVSKAVSESIRKKWETEEFRKNRGIGFAKWLNTRTSKIEKLVAIELKDFDLEQNKRIGKYVVDFVNNSKKIIIEVNGDYWHCNPDKYKADYYHQGKRLTAQQIWDYDLNRQIYLEELGYKVFIIWENKINQIGFSILEWFKNETGCIKTI